MSSLTRLEGNRWVVNLDFNIHTKNKLLGDGIGVWFTETHIFKGEANGGPDRWSGLAILIDTYDNDKKKDNPLIIGIINDGTKIYNPDTDGLDIASGKCTFKDLVNDKNLVTTLTVIYDGNEDTIEVMIKNSKRTTNCFTISNVPLNNPYLSFSGKTGGVSETANLLKLEIEELTGEKSSIKEEKKKSPKKRNSNAGNKKEDEALIGLDLEELFGDKENEEDQVDYALKYLTEKIQMITNRVENIKELSSENNVDYEAVINYIKDIVKNVQDGKETFDVDNILSQLLLLKDYREEVIKKGKVAVDLNNRLSDNIIHNAPVVIKSHSFFWFIFFAMHGCIIVLLSYIFFQHKLKNSRKTL